MFRAILAPHRLLPIVIGLTLIMALLPPRFLRWTNLPAEIEKLVIAPFGHWFGAVGETIRPVIVSGDARGRSQREEDLLKDNEDLTRRLRVEEDRVKTLKE